MWLDVFTFLRNKLNFIVFFSHEKKISDFRNFRKFSREMVDTKARWTCYGGHMVKAKRDDNSQLWLRQRESITHNSG